MKKIKTIAASLLFVSSLTFAMRFEFPLPVEKNTAQLTKIAGVSCGVLGLYKIAKGTLSCCTLHPFRGARHIGWGAISLCAAVALYQWSQALESNNQFKIMAKN